MAQEKKTEAAKEPGERIPPEQSDTPMFRISRGIYRGHLPKDASPEVRAAQEIKDRETVERFEALRKNLERNIASEIGDDQAEVAKNEFCEDVTEQEIAAGRGGVILMGSDYPPPTKKT